MSEGNINTNVMTNKTSKQTQIHDNYKTNKSIHGICTNVNSSKGFIEIQSFI